MYFHTRSQFTHADYDFARATIGNSEADRQALECLFADPISLTELLHDRRIFDRLMRTPPLLLSVSPQFFFYIFVYHALRAKGIADDDLVDYVAGICSEFRLNDNLWQGASAEGGIIYFVDLMNMMNDLNRSHQFYLRLYIGNATLFLTGFFPDFLYRRSRLKGAPALAYYESIGREQYGSAALQAGNSDADAVPVLHKLAERFVVIRMAMNLYTDAYLAISRGKHSLQKIERQAATLDEESFRQSLTI